jgi:hypothetical protein
VDGLVNAFSELVASVLRRIGVVGPTRRRNAITSDLELLDRLRQTPDFGSASPPHQELKAHIEAEIRAYTGSRKEPRKREWSGIIVAAVLGAAVGYGAYRANAVGWWLALPAWIVAGILALVVIVGIASPPDASSSEQAKNAA